MKMSRTRTVAATAILSVIVILGLFAGSAFAGKGGKGGGGGDLILLLSLYKFTGRYNSKTILFISWLLFSSAIFQSTIE